MPEETKPSDLVFDVHAQSVFRTYSNHINVIWNAFDVRLIFGDFTGVPDPNDGKIHVETKAALQELNQTAAASAKEERKALGVTVQDVQNAQNLNKTIAAEFAANKLDKTVKFLEAMGVTLKDTTDKAEVEAAYRDLANRALDDPDLKKKFDEAAKANGLYK